MTPDGPAPPSLPASSPARWGGRVVILLLLGTLLWLSYLVLRNFMAPMLWATILAYVTWPLNRTLRRWFKARHALAALTMTLIITFAIVLPLLLVVVALRQEAGEVFDTLRASLEGGAAAVPLWLREIPAIGPRLSAFAERVAANPDVMGDWLATQATALAGEAAGLLGIIGRSAFKFGIAVIAVFFLLRDGEYFLHELRRALRCLLGAQAEAYWSAAASMTEAVVYGLVLTALAQGALAGLGYWVVGVEGPVLLGALTALLALVPFGAPIVWVTVSLWLLWQGDLWAGIGLLVWGAIGVSSVDNVVRPLVISASANISFLLVLFGVLGGLSAFGLVGLFLGPVVLSVLWSVWRHWLRRNEGACIEDIS